MSKIQEQTTDWRRSQSTEKSWIRKKKPSTNPQIILRPQVNNPLQRRREGTDSLVHKYNPFKISQPFSEEKRDPDHPQAKTSDSPNYPPSPANQKISSPSFGNANF